MNRSLFLAALTLPFLAVPVMAHEVLHAGHDGHAHVDFIHDGHLHHLHGDHADDHGPVKLLAAR